MKKENKAKGDKGETLAAEYLSQKGMEILTKNWRYSRTGELDIIAKEGNTLVFVEVKTRTSSFFGSPIEAVDERKFKKMQTLAEIFISQNPDIKFKDCRFDVVGILLKTTPEISYFKNIF